MTVIGAVLFAAFASSAGAAGPHAGVASPFPTDEPSIVLRSRHVDVRVPLDAESLAVATTTDSLWNPSSSAVEVDLGILSYPPIEQAEEFEATRFELTWNGKTLPLELRMAPARDWNGIFGFRVTQMPQARIKVKPDAGVLICRQRVAWSLGIVNGIVDQQIVPVLLSGIGRWAEKPARVRVTMRPEPRLAWLEWVAAASVHPRAISTRPKADRVDENAVEWSFFDWEPTEGRGSHDTRLMLVLEPREVSR